MWRSNEFETLAKLASGRATPSTSVLTRGSVLLCETGGGVQLG